MTYNLIFIATGVGAVAFLTGGIISHRLSHFLARNSASVIALTSGAMLAIVFAHVLPEATAIAGGNVWLAVLAGVLFFYLLEHFFCLHDCPDHAEAGECLARKFGPLATVGFGVHGFFDGVLIVLAFMADPTLGWFATLGIALHKLPAGAMFHALICYKHESGSLTRVLLVALATPLAVGIVPFLADLPEVTLGLGLAFTAGALLYITLSDLLPETHRVHSKMNLVWLMLGLALVFGVELLV